MGATGFRGGRSTRGVITAKTQFPPGVRGCAENDGAYSFTMLRGVRKDVLSRRPLELLDALRRTRSSLATDPRDKVFALLGLTFDGRHFVPEPNYIDSVSTSFTDFATALIRSIEGLDFIYLRSANRKLDDKLPSWVPDWTDVNDPVARRQLDYIVDHRSHRVSLSEGIFTHRLADISIYGTVLIAESVLFDTIEYLGSALTADGGAILSNRTTNPVKTANPYKSQDEISNIVYQTLLSISTQKFGAGARKSSASFPRDFYRNWDISGLEFAKLTSVPQDIAIAVCTWLAENRGFEVHGRTVECWTKLWSESGDEDQSLEDQRQFFSTVQSCMRLLMTKRGYLGWAHPQAHQGDRIAFLVGCSRPVILRAYRDTYRVVGDATLSGQSVEDMWEITSRDQVEKVRVL